MPPSPIGVRLHESQKPAKCFAFAYLVLQTSSWATLPVGIRLYTTIADTLSLFFRYGVTPIEPNRLIGSYRSIEP